MLEQHDAMQALIDWFSGGEPDALMMGIGVVMIVVALVFIYGAFTERSW